jgi:D-alanine--poly(phosphoribitol) ligase subunit 1
VVTRAPSVLRGPAVPLPAPSVVEMVRQVVRQHPGAVALRDHGGEWTYSWLWGQAAAIAGVLRDMGVSPGGRVALWGLRTRDIVASALGIMSLGAAYVPIDPAYPSERVRAVLRGSAPAVLVFDPVPGAPQPPLTSVPVLDTASVVAGQAMADAAGIIPAAGDLAYIVFTSGSTGRPKGVAIEHRSLVNYVCWFASVLGARGGGNPLFGSLGFDHTITSLWPALASGGHLRLAGGPWDVDTLFGARPEPFDFIKVTPSQLRFFERVSQPEYRRLTRLLVSGGERLDTQLLKTTAPRLAGLALINHYGPTETTVGCCYHRFDVSRIPELPSVPIGRPVWNTRAYLVDDQLAPAGPGRPAELVIAGAGVSRGYVGVGAGSDAFIDEADLGGPPGRAYRTGDQVELLADDTLLYLGRADEQVKVSGYRVSLAEVRQHALAVDGVADAAFTLVSSDGASDVGDWVDGVVASRAQLREPGLLAEEVRRHLMRVLPAAAVPRKVRVVADLALSVHGKRDLQAARDHGQHSQ